MATKNCTYNGMANFNGGWSPSSGYSKSLDGYIGDGGGYGCVMQFVIPSAAGAASGRSLKITIDLMTLYYSDVVLEYWVTNTGRPDGPNYGDGPPAVQGTQILHGTSSISGLNEADWSRKTFTTGSTTSLPAGGGTYYLWIRCNRNAVVRASVATFVLNYTAVTACTAPGNANLAPASFGDSLSMSWSAGGSGVSNTLTGYEIQQAIKPAGGSWSGWSAYTVASASATSINLNAAGIPRTSSVKYRIRSQGSAGSSYYSGWVESNEAYRVPEALGAPTAVSATTLFDKSISIAWSGATSKVGNNISSYYIEYRVKRSGGAWGDWIGLNTVSTSATSGSYTHTPGASYGDQYQYRVRAQGTAGSSYYSGFATSNTATRNSPPTAPTYLSTSSNLIASGNSLTLTWGGASDANGNISYYLLYKSANNGSRQQIARVNTSATSGSYTYTAADAAGTVLVFFVKAVDAMGYESDYRSSGTVRINAPPTAPTEITVEESEVSRGDVLHIAWSGAADVDSNISGYRIGAEVGGRRWTLASVSTAQTSGSVAAAISDDIPDNASMRIWVQVVDDIGSTSGYAYAQSEVLHLDRNLYLFKDGQRTRKAVYLVQNGNAAKKRLFVVRDGTPTEIWAFSDEMPETELTQPASYSADAGEITIENSIDGLIVSGTLTAGAAGNLEQPYIEVDANGTTYRIDLPHAMAEGEIYNLKERKVTGGESDIEAPSLGYPPLVACGKGTTKLRSNGMLTIQAHVKAVIS